MSSMLKYYMNKGYSKEQALQLVNPKSIGKKGRRKKWFKKYKRDCSIVATFPAKADKCRSNV